MNSSLHIDNKKKDTLILGKGSTNGLDDPAEKQYNTNFTEQQIKLCLRWHHNRVNSYIFVTSVGINIFKAKDSEINAAPLCLGNVSKTFSVTNVKKTGLYGYVYDFSVKYDR